LCDKTGHKADDYWENTKNAAKRPSWWKSKTEEATGAAVDTNIEVFVVNIDYCMTCIEPEVDLYATSKFDEDYYNSQLDESEDEEESDDDHLITWIDDEEWIEDEEWIVDEFGAENMKREIMLPSIDNKIRIISIDELTHIESNEEVDKEAGLVVHDSSHTLAMLKNPNVFVIDSGATIHSTGDSRCLFDMKKTGTSPRLAMGKW
jgi:hypothetical protein